MRLILRTVFFGIAVSSTVVVKVNAGQPPPANQSTSADDSVLPEAESTDWGDWALQPSSTTMYGVGIFGAVESELSELDKSSLLESAKGVALNEDSGGTKQRTPPKDINRMMEELEAMEAEVSQALEDETEF